VLLAVGAVVRAEAQFVLLSGDHVPLKSASYVYDYLMRKSEQSKICFSSPQHNMDFARSERKWACQYRDSLQAQKLPAFVDGFTKQEKVPGRVRKHHQWIVLARAHVVDVLDKAEESMRQYLRAVLRASFPIGMFGNPAVLGASDESFVATALLLASEERGLAQVDSMKELRAEGVISECTSFVYWRHCFSGTRLGARHGWNSTLLTDIGVIVKGLLDTPDADWYDVKDSPAKLLNDSPRDFGMTSSQPSREYLEDLVNAGFLFARKFGKDEHGKLSRNYSSELPLLWAAFSSRMGARSPEKLKRESEAWPVLDAGVHLVKATALQRIPEASHQFNESV